MASQRQCRPRGGDPPGRIAARICVKKLDRLLEVMQCCEADRAIKAGRKIQSVGIDHRNAGSEPTGNLQGSDLRPITQRLREVPASGGEVEDAFTTNQRRPLEQSQKFPSAGRWEPLHRCVVGMPPRAKDLAVLGVHAAGPWWRQRSGLNSKPASASWMRCTGRSQQLGEGNWFRRIFIAALASKTSSLPSASKQQSIPKVQVQGVRDRIIRSRINGGWLHQTWRDVCFFTSPARERLRVNCQSARRESGRKMSPPHHDTHLSI